MKLHDATFDFAATDTAERTAIPFIVSFDSRGNGPSIYFDFGDRADIDLVDDFVAAFNKLQSARFKIEGAGRD
jgi:hypothetical protein